MNSSYDIFRAASAEYDLKEIIDFIARENPENASKIVTEICKKASELKNHPERGRIVPELQSQGIFLYRELFISPWRIIHGIKDTQLNVLSVLDSQRNVEDILLERLIKRS
ncbi:type II toxin-antitoxin system RelE/ParE family toxin [Prosthecochloris sp. SCSIO W1101]|uniref:type II toxin-antitoxin system RelE/ParE family toxin n=1 Tax=Prosthecochloris sp. SCSIO W1101 TaxID=2992242 RepID=UPI00223D0CA8|nr:type II toxin-antitoxin system RelE/ParE family toxin [Prosthecochloris sp. SCSIO W1101]UZJ40980.1 type II toxin-antitoxin system RelE/ParE family toxin [Prosthecochloris sp. SCSIO W1101]